MRLTWRIRHGRGYFTPRHNRKPYGKGAGGYKPGEAPAVFRRGNREPWFVTITFDDFMKLYQAGGQVDENRG